MRTSRDNSTQSKRVFEIPPDVAARLARPVKNSKLPGLPQMDAEAEERWWANVWRERGLPDAATVTVEEYRAAVKIILDKSGNMGV